MKSFQYKKGWKRVLESKPVLALLGVLVLIFAWSVFGLVGKMQETIKNKQAVEAKITDLEKSKEKLSTDLSKLQTDEGKEESIREKFGWVKQGEGVIVIVDDKTSQQANAVQPSSGFFSWFINLFK